MANFPFLIKPIVIKNYKEIIRKSNKKYEFSLLVYTTKSNRGKV